MSYKYFDGCFLIHYIINIHTEHILRCTDIYCIIYEHEMDPCWNQFEDSVYNFVCFRDQEENKLYACFNPFLFSLMKNGQCIHTLRKYQNIFVKQIL